MCFDLGVFTGPLLAGAAMTAAEATAAGATTSTAAFLSAPLYGAAALPSLSTVAGLAGSLLTGIGSIVQGQQSKTAADYNAEVAKRQALDAERRGSVAEGEQRLKTRQIIGAQRVAMGASGIVPDEGSFGDLLAQSATFGERDAQQIRINAEREAFGYRSQSKIDSYQGASLATSGLFTGASSLLTGTYNLFKPDPYWMRWTDPLDRPFH